MSSSACRGQVEPLPALLALAAFAVALSLYGTTLEGVPVLDDPSVPDSEIDSVVATLDEGTVVQPGRLDRLAGYSDQSNRQAVAITAGGSTWRRGPRPPADAQSASRRVLVDTPDGIRPGTVRVSTWT